MWGETGVNAGVNGRGADASVYAAGVRRGSSRTWLRLEDASLVRHLKRQMPEQLVQPALDHQDVHGARREAGAHAAGKVDDVGVPAGEAGDGVACDLLVEGEAGTRAHSCANSAISFERRTSPRSEIRMWLTWLSSRGMPLEHSGS